MNNDQPTDKLCAYCGKAYAPQLGHLWGRFCTSKCKSRHADNLPLLPETVMCAAPGCGKHFKPNKRKRFCDNKCKRAYQTANPIHTRVCEHCKKEFKTNSLTHRYCSLSCGLSDATPKITKKLVCTNCKTEFEFKGRTSALYCKACRKVKNKEKNTRYSIKHGRVVRSGIGSGNTQWGPFNHRYNKNSAYNINNPNRANIGYYAPDYRRVCLRKYPKCCVICASEVKIDIHHIDGDPLNSDITNLVPVCESCHMGKLHNKRQETVEERLATFEDVCPWLKKERRSKIAELSEKLSIETIRTEVENQRSQQGQSIPGDPQ